MVDHWDRCLEDPVLRLGRSNERIRKINLRFQGLNKFKR